MMRTFTFSLALVLTLLALSFSDESSVNEIIDLRGNAKKCNVMVRYETFYFLEVGVDDVSSCLEYNAWIMGKRIRSKKKVKNWSGCYKICLQNRKCKAWTYFSIKKRSSCFLYSKVKGKRYRRKAVSSLRICPEYQSTNSSTEDLPCPTDFSTFTLNNISTCYKGVRKRLIWPEAVAECKDSGGDHLASIHNVETNTFIRSLLGANAFLGGYRDENGVWQWTDGSEWDYERWATGNPSGGNEDKLIMSTGSWEDSRWNDVCASCEDGGYVCQAESKSGNYCCDKNKVYISCFSIEITNYFPKLPLQLP